MLMTRKWSEFCAHFLRHALPTYEHVVPVLPKHLKGFAVSEVSSEGGPVQWFSNCLQCPQHLLSTEQVALLTHCRPAPDAFHDRGAVKCQVTIVCGPSSNPERGVLTTTQRRCQASSLACNNSSLNTVPRLRTGRLGFDSRQGQ
jgi:hypothetical protein